MWRHGERVWRVPTGGERSKGTVGVAGGAAALGRTDGGASLSGVQAIRRAGTALRSGVGRPVGGAGGLAGGSLQVRSAGPVAGLAQGGAVSPAALNRKQHAFSDSAGGAGSQEPGLARIGPQSTAAERGLGATWGHRLELAETFVDPKRYQGTVYLASNWKRVGRTRGLGARTGWTERHGERKEMLLYPAGGCAKRLRDPEDRREWGCRGVAVDYGKGELQSLRRQLEGVEDFRRAQGRKHRMAAVVSICVLARLAGKVGPTETARFAKSLTQEELRVLGTWFDPKANCWVPPSLATIHRVLDTGPGFSGAAGAALDGSTLPGGDGLCRGRQADLRGEPSRAGEAAQTVTWWNTVRGFR